MKRFSFLLLGFTLLSLTLSAQEVSAYMLKNLIRVKSVIADDKGKEYKVFGGGFIVNGKYLATSYGVYRPHGFSKKPKKMVVYYNYGVDEKSNLTYDSVDIDLLYKYLPTQYDFSKHAFVEGKLETDFMVLKLKRTINTAPVIYNIAANLPKYTQMPTMAFDNIHNVLRNDTLIYLLPQYVNNVKETYQLVLFGASKNGFSGSPIFNENGEIVSIIQFGLAEINEQYITSLHKAGWIDESDVVEIRRGYSDFEPRNILFGINIKYLLDKYLVGFL